MTSEMFRRSFGWVLFGAGLAIALSAAAQKPSSLTPSGLLTEAELLAEPPGSATTSRTPVLAGEAEEVMLEGVVEFGYQDEQGRYFVDLLERDRAYLGVLVTTPDGHPVVGATPSIAIDGSSVLVVPEPNSDENGIMNFVVVGGEMGLDTVTVSLGDSSVEFAVNVISMRAAGFPAPPTIEGGLGWGQLMQATLEYKDMNLIASFPESVQSRAGTTLKLSGFMLPLQPHLEQTHFLLTSSPPSCYFHIPGGAAGSVEVLAQEGIEPSWDPIVVEGRFEPLEISETGVVYRLHDARLAKP